MVEIPPVSVEPVESQTEAPKPAKILAEVTEPTQTAVNLVPAVPATASPQPNIGASMQAAGAAREDIGRFGRDTFAALVQSQAALARGLEALSAEMAGLALSGIDTAARAATGMLGVKTLSDAIEVNAGFTRSSFDALLGGSARLSELGAMLAAETSQPILSQVSKGWMRATRFGS